ncbi:hemolysin D [Bosea sp. Root670]|uniref:Membrane fusion protein, multidrug efflux system n=1 Tax=Bosea robiniae TaxID=1036780 RepID=A0ABY0P3E5_9HYPH|nr:MULTISPECIES: efflux RND transporter periplasmic adaptor subunit [Bosea]KRE03831.1 hemolysin D [Bosea sp. Root670]TQI77185.1 membrane fusion protein (multidrug efflux system) [Bosea sp. AK1]SDH05849.1 membrane fusion protein, multidrug efflux system [Bosea robiniae]
MPAERASSSSRHALPSALLLAAVLAACNSEKAAAPPPQPQIQVSVVTLHPQPVAITAELPGRVSASLIAEIRPQVNGIIKSRLFREGSEVKTGDVLYEIDPSPYQAALDSAVAAQHKAEAAVANAQVRADRYRELLQRNAGSKQDADDAAATLGQAQADVAAAKANVEAARINLAYTKVTAPIDGRIDKSALTQGALVTANQAAVLTTIRKLDPINVDVTQSSTNLLKFRSDIASGRLKFTGPNVAVKLKLDTGDAYAQSGKLEFAEANINETTGTFSVRAEFPNPERLLLPGMFVRAEIQEGIAENNFLLPQRAVGRNTKGEATAKFVSAEGKVEERVLVTRRNIGNNWLVDSGVKDGERIIVEGGQLVRPGQTVTANEVSVDEATGELKSANRRAELPAGNTAKN